MRAMLPTRRLGVRRKVVEAPLAGFPKFRKYVSARGGYFFPKSYFWPGLLLFRIRKPTLNFFVVTFFDTLSFLFLFKVGFSEFAERRIPAGVPFCWGMVHMLLVGVPFCRGLGIGWVLLFVVRGLLRCCAAATHGAASCASGGGRSISCTTVHRACAV